MIQAYTDGVLAYDSRIDDYALLGLKTTTGLNKGGSAEIIMQPGHPAYNRFVSLRTVVEIYLDGVLNFRGRALYPSDDFYNRRTITCEGELCFLRDGIMRPYVYQDGPSAIFKDVINLYNSQVEEFKRFVIGTVTVTDANNYIRLESESPEQILDTVNKLLERCGGYIVFTTNAAGKRVINWNAAVNYRSSQEIEFGENLLDFGRSDANDDYANVLVPYGAKDEVTGERLTIAGVNNGLDFIQDYEAVALRGVIAKSVTWDDITLPENLLAAAQKYLASSKLLITSLELTAVDLSSLDKSLGTFRVGDHIRVRSKPHKVDADFQLSELTMDLLNPNNSKIVLGKSTTTLTGASAWTAQKMSSDLQRVERNVRADYALENAAAIEEVRETLTSLIQQTSEEIRTEVSETYAVNGDVEQLIASRMAQLADSFTYTFTTMQATVDENDAEARAQFELIEKYIRFEDGNIILGEAGNELVLRIENDRIVFLDDGAEVAYFNNKKLFVTDGQFLNSLRVGPFEFRPRANGNLSLIKVVG